MSRRSLLLTGCLLAGAAVFIAEIIAPRPRGSHDPAAVEHRSATPGEVSENTPPAPEGNTGAQPAPELAAAERSTAGALAARRAALLGLLALEDRRLALRLVTKTIAAGVTPPEDDPLWQEITARLAEFWGEEDLVVEARRLLLLSRSVKAQRFLVAALTSHGTRTGDEAPSQEAPGEEQRNALAADLVDLYFRATDGALKESIRVGLARVAGEELSLALQEDLEAPGPEEPDEADEP